MTTIIEKCLSIALMVLIKISYTFSYFCSVKYYFTKSKLCPPITNELLLKSACELAEKIRNGIVSSEEVVKAYISRIQDVNPVLNAVVKERFKVAIQEARNVDSIITKRKYSVNELKEKFPLLGLPITIKESIAVKGLTHSAGMIELKDVIASEDADVVDLVRKNGAIILLVSTTPELCLSGETFNNVTGTTYNPYDTRKTPGGSSGGEAALISSGASLFGIGSDLIGSIRIPACFCGIWGHKPTGRAVSLKGHYPSSSDFYFGTALTIGPLTRYFSDLQLLLGVILEENAKSLLSLNQSVPLKGVKVYILDDNNGFYLSRNVEPEILLGIRRVVKHLEVNYQCETQSIKLKELKGSVESCFKRIASIRGFNGIFENSPKGYYKELFLHLFNKSDFTWMHLLMGIMKDIYLRLPSYLTENVIIELESIKNDLCKTLGTDGVLLLPSHPTAAHFHGQACGKLYDYGYTSAFNAIGFPATQCPIGLNSKGLPIGLQIVAVTNNDRLTLRVAEEVNKLYGGWTPPPFS